MKKTFVATALVSLLIGVGVGQVNASGYTFTDLGTLYGGGSVASSINNAGQVVGWSYTLSEMHATIWNGTTLTDLGGGGYGSVFSINNAGQMVGYSGDLRGTIWNGITPTDLNDFLSMSEVDAGWVISVALDINDKGWIVGQAWNYHENVGHAFLLTPVPEPETYALFMAGLGLMGFIARRRKNGQA
jgi:probable HAF family extracellular repeat protein